MTFGQTIKKLRRDADMTQESLAELLSISPQAVSRWETENAMPDISLLLPLANLFGVTTDSLLGMDSYQRDLRKAEFDEAFHEYWKRDDKEQNYQAALRAVAEYPGNMEYMEWLATAEYYIALSNSDDGECKRLLESSAGHYVLVLKNTENPKLYSRALSGIVLSLCMLGRKDEAKEYAMRIEHEDERDEALCWCLEGEEKLSHSQKTAEKYLGKFLYYLKFANKTLDACNAVEQILQILFPDNNYQYYHNILQYNAMEKAYLFCGSGNYGKAIEELKKARLHAEAMAQYGKETCYCFTSPLFCHVSGAKNETDSDVDDIDDFICSLNNHRCFDPIRDREDFKALYSPH